MSFHLPACKKYHTSCYYMGVLYTGTAQTAPSLLTTNINLMPVEDSRSVEPTEHGPKREKKAMLRIVMAALQSTWYLVHCIPVCQVPKQTQYYCSRLLVIAWLAPDTFRRPSGRQPSRPAALIVVLREVKFGWLLPQNSSSSKQQLQ